MATQPAGPFGPVLETTVGGLLREAAERAAGVAALAEGASGRRDRRRWSYGELLAHSERVARAQPGRFSPGERVAVPRIAASTKPAVAVAKPRIRPPTSR